METLKKSGDNLTQTKRVTRVAATDDRQIVERVSQNLSISHGTYGHVKLNQSSILKLKDSTKTLLRLLEHLQSKTRLKHPFRERTYLEPADVQSVSDSCTSALKRLQSQTKFPENLSLLVDDDDCSVFKRLTRACNCLNQREYNDFIILFNQDVRLNTNPMGEVIKNLRIIKKFLYMGGDYSRHALMFLNEGLSKSTYTEKVDIAQGCAFADICNVFEEVSVVIACIAWPYKYDSLGDTITQELASEFLQKLSQLEEGRRYMRFTSKITHDIKKVLMKKGTKLSVNTVTSLHATLDTMHPQNASENSVLTYHCRPDAEGFGNQTLKTLIDYRQYMTRDDVLTHLDLLNKLSTEKNFREEFWKSFKLILRLFSDLVLELDDSEINVVITDILNNLLTCETEHESVLQTWTTTDCSTEPISKVNKGCQLVKGLPTTKTQDRLNFVVPSKVPLVHNLKKGLKRKDFNVIVVPRDK